MQKSNRTSLNKSIQFKVQDFFSVEKQYDFIITRLFWQHLNHAQVIKGLEKLTDITRSGGSVLIMDAMDEARIFYPALPEFSKVITEYARKKLVEEKRDRAVVKTIHDWVQQEDKWDVGLDMSLILPSTLQGNMDLFHQIYGLWLDLFETVEELNFNLSPAREELEDWKNKPGCYTQVGMRILRLDCLK